MTGARMPRGGMAALASAAMLAGVAAGPAIPFASEVVARYPNGSYLENLTVAADGSVLFTNYFAKAVEIWRPGQSARTYATLPIYPANIVRAGDGYLVLAHGAKFTDGPDAMKGQNQLIWLDTGGKIVRSVGVPEAVFGNGMVLSGANSALITDSVRGLILKVDLATGASAIWLSDPKLKADPARPQLPAANGLRRGKGAIFVTNTATHSVYRIAVDAQDRPRGPLTLVASAPGADDMAVASDGTIYLATHGETVVRLRRGAVDTVVDRDVEGCTSVALSPDGRTLYVLGTGGLYEGKKDEATLVRAAVGP